MTDMNKNSAGFTTIELAMVMIVFGMVFMTVMTAFSFYNREQVKAHTEEAFEASNAGLLAFQGYMRYYPCPADPSIPRGGVNYGMEGPRNAQGDCIVSGGITRVTNPGVNQDNIPGDDPIFIGAIPFNTILPVLEDPDGTPNSGDEDNDIPLRDGTTYDGWGHKLVYAVSGTLANDDTYNDNHGAIRVMDENGNSLVQEKEEDANNDKVPDEDFNENGLVDPGQYAHFAIVSHGENGRGAYASNGQVVQFCPPTLPAPTPPVVATGVSELENCDNTIDGQFLSGLRNDSGHSKNDDLVRFTINETSGLWVYAGGSSDQIHNTNSGNVGFGETAPEETLDIEGNLRAQEVRAEEYCDPERADNEGCMLPQAIAGDLATMRCPAGYGIVGIEQNAVNDAGRGINRCEQIFSGAIIPRTCPANCRVTGFERTSNGDKRVICRNRTNNNLCP